MTTFAPPPGRSSGTLTIGFGLLSITCAVYAGVQDCKISRNLRTPEGHEVGFGTYDKETGEPIDRANTHLVYTTASGVEVPLADDEIAEALGHENGHADLLGFYPMEQIDRYIATNVLQVRPKKSGKKSPFDKPFALLMRGMEDKDTFALLRWTMRGAPAYGVLTSAGNLVQVKWAEEVREPLPMPEVEVTDAEAAMAAALIDTLAENEAPILENEAVEKVREYAEIKAAGLKPADRAETVNTNAQQINDLTDLLAASIKDAKKKVKA